MATTNPESQRRIAYDALAGVGDTSNLPKQEIIRPTVAMRPAVAPAPAQSSGIGTPQERLANILNVDQGALGRVTPGVVGRPVSESTKRWAEQSHIANTAPWYVKTLTSGPVGGFLNAIQKPLSFSTSALKETIDVFTGEDASWSDFKQQYNDNYTYGRLLHDYDLLQDRDSGWQKFGAAALGFTGDVLFDPLSYLGLVGKGIGFGAKLTTKAAGNITREVARKTVMNRLRDLGGDAMNSVGKSMKQGDWHALADDLAQGVAAGGKKGTVKSGLVDLGDKGWELSVRAGEGIPMQKIILSNTEVNDLERLGGLIGKAQQKGATAVAGDDLRFAAKMMADSGLDRNMRHGADEFVDQMGKGIREQVAESGLDETIETTIKKFAGRSEVSGNKWVNGKFQPMERRNVGWLSADDAANMKLGFGLKVPGTGPLGRKLGISNKIDNLSQKVFGKGLDSPHGLRLLSSEAPIIGKLVTGIPQGIRNGILAQAAKAAGAKSVHKAFKRGGLFRLAGKPFGKEGKMSGKLADLKAVIRESDDGILIQQGKRVVHALSRGKNVGRTLKVQMSARVRAYIDEVDAFAIDNDAVSRKTVYSALGGNKAAIKDIEAVAPGLLDNGRGMMDELRTLANTTAGRDGGFLGQVDNYVPRMLTKEARDKVRQALVSRGRNTPRFRGNMAEPKGPELGRKYISKQEFDAKVADYRKKNPSASQQNAEAFIRKGSDDPADLAGQASDHKFWGIDLQEPNTPTGSIDPKTGQEILTGSVEDQIADILVASGADYMLFTDDLQVALDGYINQVSHRAGEVFAENLLFNEGVLQSSIAQYVKLPDAAAIKMARDIQKTRDGLIRATADLQNAIRESADPAVDLARNRQQQDKLNQIIKQKADELDRLNVNQEDLLQRHVESADQFAANRKEMRELGDEMAQLEAEIASTPVGPQLVKLEKKRIRLNAALAHAVNDAPTLRFAYDTLTSGTVQVMKLERAVSRIFGTPEAFEAFVGNDLLRGMNVSDIDASLREMANAGNLPESVVELPTGKWAFQTPEGKPLEMEKLFMDLDEVLAQTDRDGIGLWVGVEAELNVLDHLANDAAKIDFALTRMRKDIDEMAGVINEYAELAPDALAPNGGGVLPTPDEVVAAQQVILDATDGAISNAVVMSDPAVREALQTYYAGSSLPASQFIGSGADLDGVLKQIRSTLEGSIDGINKNLLHIQEAAEAAKQPVRLRVVSPDGTERMLTVADYVQLEHQYKAMEQYRSTTSSPIGNTRPEVEDILNGTQLSEKLGSNEGGLFEYDGKKYYVKRYDDLTAGGDPMPPGTGRNRLTGEVLGNALYRELGLSVPDSYASRNLADDSLWHVSPWIENIETVQQFYQATGVPVDATVVARDADGFMRLTTLDNVSPNETAAPLAVVVSKGMAADLLLANWDVVGGGYNNVGVSPLDGLVRIDQGSSFFYRAEGAAKADGGWDWAAMSDIDSQGGMLDQSMNENYGRLANLGMADDLTAELASQVSTILDMRLQSGGMEAWVRRMMPTPLEAQDDLQPFVDFLEKRLEVLADQFSLPFIAADSPDMVKAALAQRGFSREVIERADEAGTTMNLFHYTSNDPPLSLTSSYGNKGEGWFDTTFLNSTPGNMYYKASGEQYGYNLLLDLPEGANSIRVYGLAHGVSESAAAQVAIDISRASTPDEVARLVDEALHGGGARSGVWQNSGGVGNAQGDYYLDQFSRVFESNPQLVRQVRQVMEAWAARGDSVSDEVVQVLEALRYADELGDVRVPTDISNWTTEAANSSLVVEKIANSSYRERTEFAMWAFRKRNAQQLQPGTGTSSAGAIPHLPPRDLSEEFAHYLWTHDPEINPAIDAMQLPINDHINFGAVINAAFTGEGEMMPWYMVDFADEDEVARGAFGWEGMLESPATAGRGGGHKQIRPGTGGGGKQETLRRWYLTQFNQEFQNSLSADGYSAAYWVSGGPSSPDSVVVPGAGGVSAFGKTQFPNFMATNPAALRSMDVSMTHRNISRLTGNEVVNGKLVPAKEAITEADLTAKLSDNLEIEYEQLAKDLAEQESMITDPFGAADLEKVPWVELRDDMDHPFWVDAKFLKEEMVEAKTLPDGSLPQQSADEIDDELESLYMFGWDIDGNETELAAWMKGRGEDDAFDPTKRLTASRQAEEGETLFVEPAAFFEWFQKVSEMPKAHVGRGEPPEDILQRLVERRVELVADQQRATLAYVETSGQMLSEMDLKAAREAIELSTPPDSWVADLADTERWLVKSGMDEKQRQIDEALDMLDRLGAPIDTPLEGLSDDLIELRLAVGALIEGDNAMLDLALDEFQRGAEGWTDLISKLPDQKLGDLHKVPQAEEMIENIFFSGMKEFGRLQGSGTLVDSMLATEMFTARGSAAGFLSKYDKLHNLLRAYMIAKPGFHGRNFMSGAFMNHLAGMDWSSYRKFMRAYWKYQEEEAVTAGLTAKASRMRKAMRGRMINPENVSSADVDIIRELARTGSLGSASGQVASEFVESSGRGILARRLAPNANVRIGGRDVNVVDAINPMNTRNAPLRLSKQFGMATETFLRGSLGFDTLKKGGTASEAFDNIMKFHFDYDDLSDFERNVVKRVVPFYTWTRKNMPLMMEQFARQPEVFNRYVSLKKEVELMSEDDEGGIVPRWMQRQGAIRLPFKYKGENMMILPDMPFKAPLELLDPTLAFDKDLGIMERAEIALGTFGTQLTPIIKAPYEWKAKQNLWKGYSFDGRPEPVPTAYAMIPGMMRGLQILGIASKNYEDEWVMPDHALHGMAQLLPSFTDYRRLFPDEEKYQQRAVSNWISWFAGIGLRTNTKWEQQQEMRSRGYDMREERAQERALRRSHL